jgi:hypothetical protein
MNRSIDFHLDLGEGEWPRDLVGPLDLANMRRAAQAFPAEVAGLFAECHLSLPQRTDLVARILAEDRQRLLDGGAYPDRFIRFVRYWCREDHAASILPAIDIECDDGGTAFLCPYFEPDLIRGHRAIAARRRREVALGADCLALSHGPAVMRALDPELPDVWLDRLTECVEALPPYGVLIPGWSQRTRPNGAARPALRVIIALPRHVLPSYLERLHWRGKVSEALSTMNLLRPSSPWVGFDADIGAAGLGDRLGFYQEHHTVCSTDPELEATLARLEATGWCEPGRLHGLRRWVAQQPAQPEPGQGRSLSLKVVTAEGARPTVKAYVSTFDVPIAMRQSEQAVRRPRLNGPAWPS